MAKLEKIKLGSTFRKEIPLLSNREIEVLELISLGYTNAEIGVALNIGVETVKSHRGHLLKKLKAKNSAKLIRVGFTLGLLSV